MFGRKVFAKGKRRTKVPGEMNKAETAYADELNLLKHAGEVAEWWYERMKLKLADKTYWTPDFMVMFHDGMIELHEVKGFMEDDAAVKIKISAEQFPFPVVVVRQRPKRDGGGFSREVV